MSNVWCKITRDNMSQVCEGIFLTLHYHVLSGLHNYMPENNDFCQTKSEARESLKFWVRNFRDQKYRFKGNSKSGYYECINANLYLEITECTENQCMDEDIEN